MKNNFLFATLLVLITACKAQQNTTELFKPIAPNFNNKGLILPIGFTYQILFTESDTVVTNAGIKAKAKGSQDMVLYIPINKSSQHGYLYINHEEHKPNAVLGDGGGGTIFEVKKIGDKWSVIGNFNAIDFKSVGETFRNCGGTLTPTGTILTTEEEFPTSNTQLMTQFGITDTSDFEQQKKYLNYGWVIEVDPITKKAISKVKNFGRYRHEDAQCMPDGKTIYLTADNKPAVIYKFIAEGKGDYSKGQLYAYQQTNNGESGTWIALPMQSDSLANIIDVSLRKGATMFISHEWIEAVGDKLYITESGTDEFNFDAEIKMGALPAKHLNELCRTTGNNYKDPFGRLLELDLITNKLRVLLNGGINPPDSLMCFSNPDAMTSATIQGKNYLIISEDTHGNKNGKASAQVVAKDETYNEVYFLDLRITNPTLADLKRFIVAPEGCETTGNMFTPDGKTYFLSLQHPSTTNPAPFNQSSVIVVSGF